MLEVLHYPPHYYQASLLGAEESDGNLISSGAVTLKYNSLQALELANKNNLTI